VSTTEHIRHEKRHKPETVFKHANTTYVLILSLDGNIFNVLYVLLSYFGGSFNDASGSSLNIPGVAS
jgi:hypothetical protein